jgi:hypothetical protein
VENYNHQHQDLRVENGVEYGDTIDKMDFAYFANVVRLNVAALAWLASALPPPEPTVEGAVETDTTVTWKAVAGATGYVIRWRRTDASRFEHAVQVPASATRHVLKGIRVDDWVFGVSSLSRNGFASPVAAAVPGGAFKPYVTPVEKK